MFNVNDKITSSDNTEADALVVFKKAVSNGQTRLALEALVDVIDSIVEFLTSEPEEETAEQVIPAAPAAPVVNVNAVEIKEEKIESASAETAIPSKKSVKETTKPISE
jgi:hypothetical protein